MKAIRILSVLNTATDVRVLHTNGSWETLWCLWHAMKWDEAPSSECGSVFFVLYPSGLTIIWLRRERNFIATWEELVWCLSLLRLTSHTNLKTKSLHRQFWHIEYISCSVSSRVVWSLFFSSSFSSRWFCTPVSAGVGVAGLLRRAPAPRPLMRSTTSPPFCWDPRRVVTVSVAPDPSSTPRSSACPSARHPSWTTATARRTSSLDSCWTGRFIWTMTCAVRELAAWTVWGKSWGRPTTNTAWITEVRCSKFWCHDF